MAAHLMGMAFIPYYDHLMNLLKTNPELHKTAKGSLVGYRMSDDYQSLIDVLQDLSEAEKAELVKKVQELVGSTSIEALTRFIGTQAQRSALLNLLRSAASEMSKGG